MLSPTPQAWLVDKTVLTELLYYTIS